MTENKQEENGVWVENLWEGTWLLKIQGGKLLGYRIHNDPCSISEDDGAYEEGLIPTFDEYSERLGLEPEEVRCVFQLFKDSKPMEVKA